MASGPTSRAGQQQQQQEEETEEPEGVKTEGLLTSRKAVLPSEIRRRERSTEDPRRGRREEEVLVARIQSLNQARESEAEDGHRGRGRRDESERGRERENAIYVHKGLTASHIQPRATHAGPGSSMSSSALNRTVSDAGDPQRPSHRNLQHQAQDPREVREADGYSNRESLQDTRVSVAQLRNSYMESTTTPPSRRRNEL